MHAQIQPSARHTAHPLLTVALGLLFVLLLGNIVTSGFARIGLRPMTVIAVLIATLLGSFVNIPLWRREVTEEAGGILRVGLWIYYRPPVLVGQVLAINVGGGVIPLVISAWLLPHVVFWKAALAVAVVALVAYRLARLEPRVGIVMPPLIPPLLAAALGFLLSIQGSGAAPLAYIAGTVGTLVGADLLHLRQALRTSGGVLSIGGAGLFDGVFLTGLFAALLS